VKIFLFVDDACISRNIGDDCALEGKACEKGECVFEGGVCPHEGYFCDRNILYQCIYDEADELARLNVEDCSKTRQKCEDGMCVALCTEDPEFCKTSGYFCDGEMLYSCAYNRQGCVYRKNVKDCSLTGEKCDEEIGYCTGKTCEDDPGCSNHGSYCQGSMPYTCHYHPELIDWCLDRTNGTDCSLSGKECINGECV